MVEHQLEEMIGVYFVVEVPQCGQNLNYLTPQCPQVVLSLYIHPQVLKEVYQVGQEMLLASHQVIIISKQVLLYMIPKVQTNLFVTYTIKVPDQCVVPVVILLVLMLMLLLLTGPG